MNDFRVTPARTVATPGYPCSAHQRGASQGSAGSVPVAPLIANRVSRLAPLVLIAAAPALSSASPKKPGIVACEGRQDAVAPRPAIQRLSESEIEGLVGELKAAQQRVIAMKGEAVAAVGVLTEKEATSLLTAFLKKNGFDAQPLRREGLEPGVWDPAKRAGFTWLKIGDPYNEEPQAGAAALTSMDDLALLRARGEARVLVMEDVRTRYDIDGAYGGRIPTKRGVVHALLAEVERFLEESR